MRGSRSTLALLFIAGTVVDCECSDSLTSIVGELHLELCSSDPTCGCIRLAETDATIDFGNPEVGDTVMRTFYIYNDNKPQSLNLSAISLVDDGEQYRIDKIKHWTSQAADAVFAEVDMDPDLTLFDEQFVEAVILFEPKASDVHTATLTVVSNSSSRPRWDLTLRAGPAQGAVFTHDNSCPATPASEGEPNCVLDLGTYSDSEVGFDPTYDLPLALGEEKITITNNGERVLFVGITLTDDGIPETSGTEQVGEFGVFFLKPFLCTELLPGDTLNIGVEFRPFQSGTFYGEVKVSGFDEPIRVQLLGQVTGPAVCITSEDQEPNNAELQFGDPPYYTVPRQESEERSIFIENCGYVTDLVLSDALPSKKVWNPAFASTWILPWTYTTPIAVGEKIEIPFTFSPGSTAPVGEFMQGNIVFFSNTANGTSLAKLYAGVGAEKQCLLKVTPKPVRFGWVAANEANVPTPPNVEVVSRSEEVVFLNIGQAPCENIVVAEPDGAELDPQNAFTSKEDPYGGAGFGLLPAEASDPIVVMFSVVRPPGNDPVDFAGRLPYTSDSITANPTANCPAAYDDCIPLLARGGGNPNCELSFTPVNPPGPFCAGHDGIMPFGNVNIGQERTIDLKITNIGSDACHVTSISLQGNAGVFSAITPPTPHIVPINDSLTIPVTFAPVPPSGGIFDDLPYGCLGGLPPLNPESISFTYESINVISVPTTTKISLAGKGTKPEIDVIPGDIDFGLVTVGCCSADKRVAVYNSGDGTLTIRGVGFSCDPESGDCDEYSGADPQKPVDPGFHRRTKLEDIDLVLDPGEKTEFFVRFCAAAAGEHSGVLEIVSSDGDEQLFTVSLSGTGTFDDEGHDVFNQPDRPMVDVLWVVDNSGSMVGEQQDLANNFDVFISTAVELNTNYHIGVTTTYVKGPEAGKLFSCTGPLWITGSQPIAQQQSQFRCNVKVSDADSIPDSDSQEAGLQAARLALDYPNIDDHNLGFYREAAKLYIIIVTDEEDQSAGQVEMYVDFFRNLKGLGNPDLLNISAVAGHPNNECENTADPNDVDYDAVQMVGGQFRSICTPDWSDMIAALGLDVFNARRQFPLSRPATASTITVTVCDTAGDCMPIQESALDGWTFDADYNTVTFHGSAVPGPGAEIRVDYTTICYQ